MKRLLVRGRGVVGWSGADTILLEADRIAAIGPVEEFSGIQVQCHDGYLSAPRHDHHFHPFGYAGAINRLNLKDAVDFSGLAHRLRMAASRLRSGEALTANRLDDEALTELRLPNRWEIDAMVGTVPTLLNRYCGHVAVANSAALALASLEDHPDGILREQEIDPVMTAVAARQAPLTEGEAVGALRGLASHGLGTITAIVSGGVSLWCEVPDELATFLAVAGGVPLNFEVLVIASEPSSLEAAAADLRRAGDNVVFFGWKEFADGALGGRTASLYEAYDDDPENHGILRLDRDEAEVMARACLNLEGVVALHAIGDRANDAVLDLFTDLIESGVNPQQLRIEHASILTPSARQRMARLGVTASVQPSFITSETSWLGKRLGDRVENTYALAPMEEAGIRLLGGSDCPVESPNPWEGMAAAQVGGLSPESAYYLYGPRLEVGDPTNVIIVDRDPMLTGVEDTTVLAFYRNGEQLELEPMPRFI